MSVNVQYGCSFFQILFNILSIFLIFQLIKSPILEHFQTRDIFVVPKGRSKILHPGKLF